MKQKEIKFRAWDKVQNKMLEGNLVMNRCDLGNLLTNKSIYKYWSVMQYTGLKDKNKKEIWEGDILDCLYKFDGCIEHKLMVVFDEDNACFRLKSIGECHQPNVEKRMSDMTRSEVIGNIYSNPELLKK